MFEVHFEKPAEKFIDKLKDKVLLKRLLDRVEALLTEPFPSECVRVKEYKKDKVFRVRVGAYRILYYVNYEKNLLDVVNIDKRPRAY
jgi:mRNA-degrading endonuclease RelE of RelBE toxin-antitoxin system